MVLHYAEAGRSRGAVRQALSAALQQELTELYRVMAVLEAQLAHPLPMPGAQVIELNLLFKQSAMLCLIP